MSFIDNYRFEILKGICEICEDNLRKKIIEDLFPKKYRDSKGWVIGTEKIHKKWLRHHNFATKILNKLIEPFHYKICFKLNSIDYGEQELMICKKHLLEIVEAMEAKE